MEFIVIVNVGVGVGVGGECWERALGESVGLVVSVMVVLFFTFKHLMFSLNTYIYSSQILKHQIHNPSSTQILYGTKWKKKI